MPVMTIEQMSGFLAEHFPQGEKFGVLIGLGDSWAEMKLPVDDEHLRPGGTVSGPSMMALADVCMYAALLGQIGPVALAVTTNLNINFMSKPEAGRDLVARCNLMKVGKRLAVGEVWIRSEGCEELVAHTTLTYSIPAER
ncbi:PaaI family thioesterase [uncultured Amphritea sp.]|uniref:PaaI family thioesterase n=1 Tax=uncultured Amphritea sp. TaxID=981605 RepID=UPI0026325D90|nr:PaaI family thioesterase [uncultured Amphritea sp.]